MTAIAVIGWLLALGAAARALVLRRRLELVADAEHELRGPLAALALAAEASRRRARSVPVSAVEGQLERARAGLADLVAARSGRRAATPAARQELGELVERAADAWSVTGADVRLDWRAGGAAALVDSGRLSQALGNLLANAVEHGGAAVTVRGIRTGRRVRIELRNSSQTFGRGASRGGRGRGLPIAERAVREAGGALQVTRNEREIVAAIELSIAEP